MAQQAQISAGILLFRRTNGAIEVFLAHMGGPFWAKRDVGAWSIPKGLVDPGEELLDAARREFAEETGIHVEGPFLSLGSIQQKAGKIVHAWACEGDADPAKVQSNTMRIEWPRGSGRWQTFPEVDRCAWFSLAEAKKRIVAGQAELLDRLDKLLAGEESG